MALKNIVENNVFWASKNDFLNDSKEHEYITTLIDNLEIKNGKIKNKIQKLLNRYFSDINLEYLKEDCGEELNAFIDDIIKKNYMDEIYVISFSTEADSLTLWGTTRVFKGIISALINRN